MIGFPTRYSSSYVLSRRNRMLLVAVLVPSTDTRLNWFLGENLTLHGRLRSRKISAKGYSLESGKYYNFLKYEETVRHFDAGSYFGWLTIDSYENAQKYVKIEKKQHMIYVMWWVNIVTLWWVTHRPHACPLYRIWPCML